MKLQAWSINNLIYIERLTGERFCEFEGSGAKVLTLLSH